LLKWYKAARFSRRNRNEASSGRVGAWAYRRNAEIVGEASRFAARRL
jgi:hypothetical protein